MSELFKIEPSPSPRLAWMRKHDLRAVRSTLVQPGDEDEFSGERVYPWCAFTGEPRFPRPDAGYGDTEDDAIADWARKHGVRLWNEEGL